MAALRHRTWRHASRSSTRTPWSHIRTLTVTSRSTSIAVPAWAPRRHGWMATYIVLYLSPRHMGKSSGNPSISPFPAGGENFVLCRPIIHDFSWKMASPRLPVCARHMRAGYSCTHKKEKKGHTLPHLRTPLCTYFYLNLGLG